VTTRPLQVTFRAIDILERYEVPYCLVGSLATSAVGIPRATIDADLIADFTPDSLVKAVESFGASGFYVSLHAAEDALRRKGMFNIIDLATSFKVDVYILGPRPFDREEFRRRVERTVSPESDRQLTMATPEDLILSKLLEFKTGVALLAHRSGSPVVPCAFEGTQDILPTEAITLRPRTLQLAFGRSLQVEP
jgi:hypothetical protein